jgi:hypothetical protein
MILRKVLLVWLIILCTEFLHGILRTVLLVPYIGDFHARQIGVFSGSILIIIIVCLFIRWIGAQTVRSLIATGIIWLILMLLFELCFGRFILRLPWWKMLEDYDIARGGLLPFGMLFLTFSPLIAARLRGIRLQDDNIDVLPGPHSAK